MIPSITLTVIALIHHRIQPAIHHRRPPSAVLSVPHPRIFLVCSAIRPLSAISHHDCTNHGRAIQTLPAHLPRIFGSGSRTLRVSASSAALPCSLRPLPCLPSDIIVALYVLLAFAVYRFYRYHSVSSRCTLYTAPTRMSKCVALRPDPTYSARSADIL